MMVSIGIRFGLGLAAGVAVTFGLFYLMQALVHSDGSALRDAPGIKLADFVRVEEDLAVERRRRKPKPPPEVDEPPPDLPEPDFDTDVASLGLDVSGPSLNVDISISGQSGFTADGEYLPIVKVRPEYPRRALNRGQEGYVVLEFTVTKTGAVRNPVVIESVPPKVFDQAAIRAALKFKYKPKVVNGEPQDVPGVPHKLTFKLTDNDER